jgi:hypothetical protein
MFLIACRIVVPGVVAPLLPCHEIVQPPLWLPISFALLPATKILLAVFGSREAAVHQRMLEQPELEFLGQDAPVGVVDTRRRHPARLRLPAQQADERAVIARHHHHVDPGIERRADLRPGEPRLAIDLVDPRPIGQHEPRDAQLTPEHGSDEAAVGVHLQAVPARERDHHRTDTAVDRLTERRQMDRPQLCLTDLRVALIDPTGGAAIAHVVLGRRHHRPGRAQRRPLQPRDDRRHRRHHLRRLTERGCYVCQVAGRRSRPGGRQAVASVGDTQEQAPRVLARVMLDTLASVEA